MDKYYFINNQFLPSTMQQEYEKAGVWIDGGVYVSEDVFCQYIEPEDGKIIGTDKNGYPVWVDKPAPTHEDEVTTTEAQKIHLIAVANAYINDNLWPSKLALGRLTDDEKSLFNAWLDYLDALKAVDTSSAPDINWPVVPQQ